MLRAVLIALVLCPSLATETSCEQAPVNANQVLFQLDSRTTVGGRPVAPAGPDTPTLFRSVSWSAAAAEFVAMTLFVIIGCGSAMGVAKEPGWILQVSLSFGLAITSIAYAVGNYRAGQINCAVTFGLWLAGEISAMQGIVNLVAQLLGSVTGAFILSQMHSPEADKTQSIACNSVSPQHTAKNALIGEIMMTALLMFVVFETAVGAAANSPKGPLAAIAIGFAVFLAHSVLIPIDGCSINPTRSFGPAVVASYLRKGEGVWKDMWIFWAGPLAGAVLGYGAHSFLQSLVR